MKVRFHMLEILRERQKRETRGNRARDAPACSQLRPVLAGGAFLFNRAKFTPSHTFAAKLQYVVEARRSAAKCRRRLGLSETIAE